MSLLQSSLKLILVLFVWCQLYGLEKTHYELSTEPIDVVIVCEQHDVSLLPLCIKGIQENVENLGRVFVVSKKQLTDDAEWIDSTLFPFTEEYVVLQTASMSFLKNIAKFYQQLLKLYAPLAIPGISSNVLVVDTHLIFLKPISFLQEDGAGLYTSNENTHIKTQNHIKKLIPGLTICSSKCGKTHHMLFQRAVMEDLFQLVESIHEKPFWRAFCDCIDMFFSFPSEYELYFHFFFNRSKQPAIRPLRWKEEADVQKLSDYQQKGYHFVYISSIPLHDWKAIPH